MPWNLPMWWQLHRLRYAIAVDCDARVLRAGVDTGSRGETLSDVSQRPTRYIGSVAAMSESRSFLEERITIMVGDPAKWGSLMAVMFGSVSLALMAVAAQVTPPNVAASDSELRPVAPSPGVLDQYVGFYVRGTHLVSSVTRDGDHLFMRIAPNFPPLQLVAKDEKNFAIESGGPTLSDASGRTTGLVLHHGPFLEVSFDVPMPRIDAATADAINANNDLRAKSQTPTPGSEAALRRLIDGILAGKPNYDEMTPWYAELIRAAGSITRSIYQKRGVVRSIEFRHVDETGGDVYEVRQDAGFSTWTIFLNSSGLIEDADDIAGD